MSDVRFDDLAALQALVSDELGEPGEAIVVTQEMIDRFAELTGDRQWIHVDVERARREGPFGGTVAHGQLLLSLLPALLAGSAGPRIVGHGTAVNFGLDEVRFLAPVPSGSSVHARRRIAHVRRKGPRGTQITFDVAVYVAERLAVRCRSLVLFLA